MTPAPQPAAPMVGPAMENCRAKPAPAAPTGTPAIEPMRCEAASHDCGADHREVMLRKLGKNGKARLICRDCYLDYEDFIADKPKSEPPTPSQPPRWWSPAIESLAAVRPFGRPRGRR